MGPLVAIETSGRPGSVALLLPHGSVKERGLEGVSRGEPSAPAGHARTLVPQIKALVGEACLGPKDIRAVAVSIGPGSYTGLRVGVTAAKTLSRALSCELVAVSTLEALAREAASGSLPPGTRRLVPAVDARRGQVYAALFGLDDGKVSRLCSDEVLAPEEISRRLVPGDHVFGTAPAAYPEALVVPEGATSAAGPATPRASTVGSIGAEMLARGETAEAHDLAPNYLREWTSPRRGG